MKEKANVPSYRSFVPCGYQEVLINNEKHHIVMATISDLKKSETVRKFVVNE